MALSITTQKDLRQVQDLGFCYLCGKAWQSGDDTNRDHVPPQNIFEEVDRTPPLILRTHVACNNGHSSYDKQVGQLVSLLWKQAPSPGDVDALRMSMHAPTGMIPFGAVEGLDLRFIISRWLKGFHAALYKAFLPNISGAIHEPFPGGDTLGVDTNLHPSHSVFVREIKRNRAAGRLDSIVIYNHKCRYECSWSHLDDGRPICLWALDLYAWHRLGDINNFAARSCVGYYEVVDAIPSSAALATRDEIHFPNSQPLNAFEGVS